MRILEFNPQLNDLAIGTHRVLAARTAGSGIAPAWGAALALSDALALGLATILASLVATGFRQFVLQDPFYAFMDGLTPWRLNMISALCLGGLAMFWSKGLYTRRIPWWTQVQSVSRVVFLLFLIDGFISFALKYPESRLLILSTWLFALPLLVCARWAVFRVATLGGAARIPTVIIGDNATAADLIDAFSNDPCVGYDVHTVFLRDPDHGRFDSASLPASCRNVVVRSGLECASYVSNHPDFFYVVSLDTFPGETREGMINALREAGAAYALAPSTVGLGAYETEPSYFFGHDVMILQSRMTGTHGTSSAAKRAMDIVIAGTALLLLSPVFAVVAAMLRLEGQGGTIFYGGKRIGHRGRYFSCWKFRSMEPDSDHLLHARLNADPEALKNWEKYRKLADDPRVTTRTARFIRKASLDELPQLWNVLVGDMSIVGPRPILEDEKSYFSDEELKDYMSVRPGITGLWQVSGRNATTFARRIHWDMWYIRNWSLWGDIVILIKTPLVLLGGKGAH